MSDHANEILEALGRIVDRENLIRLFHHVLHQQERIMSGIDDLKAGVANITQAITDLNTLVEQVIAKLKQGGLSDADAEALAQQLHGGIQAINDEMAKLQQG